MYCVCSMHPSQPCYALQELLAVEVAGARGQPPIKVTTDEQLHKFDKEKLLRLRPAFRSQGGTVTAGNASPITDGAAALVLVSAERASALGLRVGVYIGMLHWAVSCFPEGVTDDHLMGPNGSAAILSGVGADLCHLVSPCMKHCIAQ